MSRELILTARFRRDLRRMVKRGKEENKLDRIVDALLAGETLTGRRHPHMLSGDYAGHWECHVEPDWLLIWKQYDDVIVLYRTGSHSDLF